MPYIPETPFGTQFIKWREPARLRNYLDRVCGHSTVWQLRVLVGIGISLMFLIPAILSGAQSRLPLVIMIPVVLAGGQILAWFQSWMTRFASADVCVGPKGLLWNRGGDVEMYDRNKMTWAGLCRFVHNDAEIVVLQVSTLDDGPVLFVVPDDRVTGVIEAFDRIDLPCKDHRGQRAKTVADLRSM